MKFKIFEPYKNKLFCEITDRNEGVSQKPYNWLNIALHVGDKPKSVIQNRTILSQKYDFLLENLIYMEQTHSDNIKLIEHPALNKISDCDALITNKTNIPLMVMVADCIAVMLYDPKQNAVAAIHAGRVGTFKSIVQKTINKMQKEFNSKPKNIIAAFSPSIHSCCYEVDKDLVDIVTKSFGEKYIQTRDKSYFLDLQKLNFDQLIQIGVKDENIQVSDICNCCDKNYFSYRREGVTGRFAGLIELRNG